MKTALEFMTTDKSQTDENLKNPSRDKVWHMFDRIAHRYDLLNRLLSFGQDIRWRNQVVKFLNNKSNQSLIDLATGTGDLLITLCQKSERITKAVGLDMSEKMLHIGEKKLSSVKLKQPVKMIRGNVENIPFEDNSFDLATIAFGVRNLSDLQLGLNEIKRILKPGGRVLILEFSLPENFMMRKGYLFYFRYILPFIGSIISGDSYAYRYLNKTVETFPYGEEFLELMKEAGFENRTVSPLTFGVASIYQGDVN